MRIGRRAFTKGVAAATIASAAALPAAAQTYRGPSVIIVRFGGGVRRAETIVPGRTFAPYLLNVLAPRGTLFSNVTIDALRGTDTSHAEGTLNLLTGRYHAYRKAGTRGLAPLLEPTAATLFEHVRKAYGLAPNEALLINGEDRPQEEYLTSGGHPHFGVAFRSEVIGLYRFKLYHLQRRIARGDGDERTLAAARKQLLKLQSHDYRGTASLPNARLDAFWESWLAQYGDSGLKHPRGDRLLTELTVRALRELRPRLVMVNYQDPEYVHWGNASHYTRAIGVIDQGIERIVAAIDTDPFYRGRTVIAIVPDCGRDANPLMAVPFQHHFNSRSAHDIFALFVGAGVPAGRVVSTAVDQTSIAATIGALMSLDVGAEGRVLGEVQS
jgi:hypothetical protein